MRLRPWGCWFSPHKQLAITIGKVFGGILGKIDWGWTFIEAEMETVLGFEISNRVHFICSCPAFSLIVCISILSSQPPCKDLITWPDKNSPSLQCLWRLHIRASQPSIILLLCLESISLHIKLPAEPCSSVNKRRGERGGLARHLPQRRRGRLMRLGRGWTKILVF